MWHNVASLPLDLLRDFESIPVLMRVHHLVQVVLRVTSTEFHTRLTNIVDIKGRVARRGKRDPRQLANKRTQNGNSEDKVVLAQFVENLDYDHVPLRDQLILISKVRVARVLVERVDPAAGNDDA